MADSDGERALSGCHKRLAADLAKGELVPRPAWHGERDVPLGARRLPVGQAASHEDGPLVNGLLGHLRGPRPERREVFFLQVRVLFPAVGAKAGALGDTSSRRLFSTVLDV